eukprot:XP_017952754.1 PREDICTED: protein kinase C delta type-like [Xenopus tropicalis]
MIGCHSDLKPDNILVDNDGHIKICDFGIAAVGMFAGWKIRGLAGTPGYRAPEMLSLEAYDAGVDWWSLGVIMYEMATGRQPFVPSIDPAREFLDMKLAKVDYPSHMSQEMLDLLPKLLEMDNNNRLGVNGTIRVHQFFAGINWGELEKRTTQTPFKPKILMLFEGHKYMNLLNIFRDIPLIDNKQPTADKLKEIKPGFCAETSEENKLEDFTYVDYNWNWQE